MNYGHYFALEKELKSYGYPMDRQEIIQTVTGKIKHL